MTDPGLARLGDYGGPTWTHALLRESPALDAGSDSVIASLGLLTDQYGRSRQVDLLGGVSLVDIGAFEAGNQNTLTVTSLGDGQDGDYRFGQFTLREAVAQGNDLPGKDVIVFDESLLDGVLTLTEGSLWLTEETELVGPGLTG